MTYTELCSRLREKGIENAEWDAALLLEHFCGVAALSLKTNPNRAYDSQELEAAVQRREARYPLQYLLGEWQFYRQTYEVGPDCLIPRSDTEILVEEAIRSLPHGGCFADLCTGSGCIAVSVLAERQDLRAFAVDKYEETLSVAKRNAERNGVLSRFVPICVDVLTDSLAIGEQLDAILCNPPYIPTAHLSSLEPELLAEPAVALDGGEDGLIFYREILRRYTSLLRPNGVLLFEIGYDQAEDVLALGRACGFSTCRVIKDLGGNDRVVSLSDRLA